MQHLRWRLAQYLERRWWRRYLSAKDAAEYLADKRAYWKRTLDRMGIVPVAGRRVLDAGCGPAGIFIWVHDREAVTALDPLLEEYERDLRVFAPEKYPTVTFVNSPLESATLSPGRYSMIYCCNAINHVADRERALEQLTTWAAADATLLLTSDVHRYRALRRVFRWLPGDALHPQQDGADDYRRDLNRLGWRIDREVVLKPGRIFNYVGWVARRTIR